jgi:uncharacterized lipoprotein
MLEIKYDMPHVREAEIKWVPRKDGPAQERIGSVRIVADEEGYRIVTTNASGLIVSSDWHSWHEAA